MIRVTTQIEDDILDAIADGALQLPTLMNLAVKRNTKRLISRMLDELQHEPGRPHYPLRWQSARQRRAFFASNGFGGGIPYRRTGKMQAAWRANVIIADGVGEFNVMNSDPASIFVQGDLAQDMHLNTGWPQAAPIISKYADQLEDVLIETWYTVVDGVI